MAIKVSFRFKITTNKPLHRVYLQSLTVNHAEICAVSTKKMCLYFEQIKFKSVNVDICIYKHGHML